MLSIISKSFRCQNLHPIAVFFINFMLTHDEGFNSLCFFCPFGFCYKYFIGLASAFQIAYSLKEFGLLLKSPPGNDILLNIPYLNIPVSHHNFDMVRLTLNLASCVDLLIRTMTSESAHELVTFTAISFGTFVYSLCFYVIKFPTLTSEQKLVQFVMNMAAILNLMFLMCFIFENCKYGYIAPEN